MISKLPFSLNHLGVLEFHDSTSSCYLSHGTSMAWVQIEWYKLGPATIFWELTVPK